MTLDEWMSQHMREYGDSLSYRPPTRVVWDAASKARDAAWQAEIESHVSAAVANERERCARLLDHTAEMLRGMNQGNMLVKHVAAMLVGLSGVMRGGDE